MLSVLISQLERWKLNIQIGGVMNVRVRVRVMVFNATLNNISVIPWQFILLVEETGLSGENHRPAASYWQT